MAFHEVQVTEIFHSLQGETSLTGVPFVFIRLTGCNLRCTYCDSSYSFKGGNPLRISEIVNQAKSYFSADYQMKHVLITGGEPLLQRNTAELVHALNQSGFQVSIETHGEVSIASVVQHARIILDIKTPSSGMSRGGYQRNLPLLKSNDEVKFVIASPEDYLWARKIVESGIIPTKEILFSPALPARGSPGKFPGVEPKWLAQRILEDRLNVRFQLQLHKLLWGLDTPGV